MISVTRLCSSAMESLLESSRGRYVILASGEVYLSGSRTVARTWKPRHVSLEPSSSLSGLAWLTYPSQRIPGRDNVQCRPAYIYSSRVSPRLSTLCIASAVQRSAVQHDACACTHPVISTYCGLAMFVLMY